MIKNITKKETRGKLEVEIEVNIKRYFSHPNIAITDEQVLKIAEEEYDVKEIISSPPHEVANYVGTGTKQVGVWVFKLAPKKRSTKSSIRGKISKIAKELNSEQKQEEQ